MKKCLLTILFLQIFALPAWAMIIDVPHNEVNNIVCTDCHTYSLWWQFSPSTSANDPIGHKAVVDSICLPCHSEGGGAPQVQAHASLSMGSLHNPDIPDWSEACTDCHNPHFQAQLSWSAGYASQLYLVSASLAPGTLAVSGDGTPASPYKSTFEYYGVIPGVNSNYNSSSTWADDPSRWSAKTGTSGRGMILALPSTNPAETFEILSVDIVWRRIEVQGLIDASYNTNGGTFGLIYGQLLRDEVNGRSVKLFNPKLTHDSGQTGGYVDPNNREGLCQACHTLTRNWTIDGLYDDNGTPISSETHYRDGSCPDCHLHNRGFGPGSDRGKHSDHRTAGFECTACHGANTPPLLADGQNLANTMVCFSCHNDGRYDAQGQGPGQPNLTDYKENWENDNYLFGCFGCHKGRPDKVEDIGSIMCDSQLSCQSCHRGAQPGTCLGTDCTACHDGTGSITGLLPSDDIQAPPVGMQTGGHARLASTQWIRMYNCSYCHYDTVDADANLLDNGNHLNSYDPVTGLMNSTSVNVVIDPHWSVASQATPYYTDEHHPPGAGEATDSCYNTYCHSDGRSVNPQMKSYPWSGGSEECNGCHSHDLSDSNCDSCHVMREWAPEDRWLSAMPMYTNAGPGVDGANSHFRHLFTGFSCDDCHADTVVGACRDCHNDSIPVGTMTEDQHVNPTYHVADKTKTVVFKNGGTYDGRPDHKTCSDTACHTGYTPVWGGSVLDNVTCKNCHGINGSDVDDFGVFNGSRAKINLMEWENTGHGRPAASGPYNSGNPAASFPQNGCWYCHDNSVLHKNEERPFRLIQHEHFKNRFEKECVFCHMTEDESECLGCHNDPESLAPQLGTINANPGVVNPPYTIERPDHTAFTGGCGSANCHVDDTTRHNSGAGFWTQDQKDDVQNSYLQMGVCLKCHDDDSGGQCSACHTGPQYDRGFDPGLPGTYKITPVQAKASSFHFGHKHYDDYLDSLDRETDTGTASDTSASTVELIDTGKDWKPDQWLGYQVKMLDGPNAGQISTILSNSSDTLVLDQGFSDPVQASDSYRLMVETGTVTSPLEELMDSGQATATSTGTTELTDAGKAWLSDKWKGYSLKMQNGPNIGQIRLIAGNTGDTIELVQAFDSPVQAGNAYMIIRPKLKDSGKNWVDDQWEGYSVKILNGQTLESGTATAAAATDTELTDGTKSWTVDKWKGHSLKMLVGPDAGEVKRIVGNTADTLTLATPFSAPVQASDSYVIFNVEIKRIESNTADTLTVKPPFSKPLSIDDEYTIVLPTWKGGKFCWDCHDPHGDQNLYMIQNKVATRTDGLVGRPMSRKAVSFTTKQSQGLSYVRLNAPFDGICNVCHTDGSQHYAVDGGDGHNAGRLCTECHEHRFTDSHSSGQLCNTCHNNRPVPRHSGFSQPRDCTKCHQGVIKNRMNIMGQFAANSHHVQGTEVTNKHCYACHWEANEYGLINRDYHQGFNNKSFSGESGREVDLVIWNDTTRPTEYIPGETATQFLAANMSQGLAAERAEVEAVTPHCLGCHDELNKNTQPFKEVDPDNPDCRTPRTYAWDGSSIAERYTDQGTTTWGKYPTVTNAAQKNITKAFSAHGNAIANGGGTDPVTGVDEAIPNTRAGQNYNIQCFDCHNSHGSKVSGITSSYTSFRGDQNGANLKETQAGKGGYSMTYYASANTNPNAVNRYQAGAGQCFDCHETANSGVTPWGYNSTFGATAPILGYKDNPHFSGSYPGRTWKEAQTGKPAASEVDLTYRSGRSTLGGHLQASHRNPAAVTVYDPVRDPNNAAYDPAYDPYDPEYDPNLGMTVQGGVIDGLCTPCHDPHGVSKSLGADKAYGVPLLKGTWLTSPFKDDLPPPDPYGSSSTALSWGKSHWAPSNAPESRYNIDRTTFGPGGAIYENAEQFAGLCLMCHPREKLEDGQIQNQEFRTKDRIHESVKGWGKNAEHSYPCSKCHQPHSSGLPRLMKTNCLNANHRGGVVFGGQGWSADSQNGTSHYEGEHRGYPAADVLGNSASTEGQTSCHVPTPLNPGSWPDANLWNEVTPW